MTAATNPPLSLTTIIISRGLTPLLQVCVRLLHIAISELNQIPQRRIVVVDNGSPQPYRPETFSPIPVDLIRFDSDQPFGQACNAATAAYPAETFLFLNNDVLLSRYALPPMLDLLTATPTVGIVGARLLFPDGSTQHAGVTLDHPSDGSTIHPHYRESPAVLTETAQEFQAVTAACMLVRNSVHQSIDGFSPAYDCGGEDIDYCLRARQQGWRVQCAAANPSLHFENQTPGRAERDPASRVTFINRWAHRTSTP